MTDVEREELRLHLIVEHHWPEITRSAPTLADLDHLHRMMHDPEVASAQTLVRVRQVLGMPAEDLVDDG